MRAPLALFAFCALYPVRYHTAGTTLDPSWAVALNQFHVRGLMHGRDIGFTYGPLAYLTLPMPFGSNLEQGVAFQLACWLVLGALLAWFTVSKRISTPGLAILAACAPAGARIIREFGYAGPDIFLEFVALLLMGACLVGPEAFYYAGVAVAALLMLIKLSSGIGAIGAMLVFALALALFDWRRGLRLLLIGLIATPVLFAALFLLFAGSRGAIVPYVRSALEISSGHSAALSLSGPARELHYALAILGGFVALAAMFYMRRDRAFPVAAAMLAPLFLEFKHSFIRQDGGHVEFVFTFAAFAFGATLIFSDLFLQRLLPNTVPSLAALLLVATPWLYFEQGRYWRSLISPAAAWRDVRTCAHIGVLKQALLDYSNQALARDRVPPDLLARIGNRSMTIYPWENALAAANPIDYRPFPVFQVYDAYTTYLDGWNASFLNDAGRRPDFVLFDWISIDGRHPLLDCPQTMLALYRNYQFDGQYGGLLLLRKRPSSLPATLRAVTKTTMRMGQPLHVATAHAAIVRVDLRHNLSGRLLDFFFRVSDVYLTLAGPRGETPSARTFVVRIPPGVVPGGIPISLATEDLADTRRLFESATIDERWDTLAITGPGSAAFAPSAEVEVFELPEVTVSQRERIPTDIRDLRNLGWLADARIELLNHQGIAAISEREVVDASPDLGITLVQGFAVPSSEKGALYVEVDGRLYPATWAARRGDVAMIHGRAALASGFTAAIPNWVLGTATHHMRIAEVSEDETSVWRSEKLVSFRVGQKAQ